MTRWPRWTLIVCLLCWLSTPRPALALELSQLESVLDTLLTQHDYPLEVELRIHPERSLGIAAILFEGSAATITVHPDRLREWSLNTWAFVLGHELGHQLHQHLPDSPALDPEFEADITGALLARAAGYDLETFVRELYGRQGCGPEHGCMSERARRLELYFDLNLGLWTEAQQRLATWNAIVGPLSDAPPVLVHRVLVDLREWARSSPDEAAAKLLAADLPPRQRRAAVAWLALAPAERDEAERAIMEQSQQAFADEVYRAAQRPEPDEGLSGDPSLPSGNAVAATQAPVALPGGGQQPCCTGTSEGLVEERAALLKRLYGDVATPEIVPVSGLADGLPQPAAPGD